MRTRSDLIHSTSPPTGRRTPLSLTYRQTQVLELATAGLARKEIARALGLSVRTVEDHFSRMRQRTGTHNDAELAAYGLANGIFFSCTPTPIRRQAAVAPGPRPKTSEIGETHASTGLSRSEGLNDHSRLPCDRDFEEPERSRARALPDPTGCRLSFMPPSQWPTREPACPEPFTPTGTLIGYARAYPTEIGLGEQIEVLKQEGCCCVFADQQAGQITGRPGLIACLDYLSPGDTLVVPSMDRLTCSVHDLISLVARLRRRELGFRSLHDALDTTGTNGRPVRHVFAALAELVHMAAEPSCRDAQGQCSRSQPLPERGARPAPQFDRSGKIRPLLRDCWRCCVTAGDMERELGCSRGRDSTPRPGWRLAMERPDQDLETSKRANHAKARADAIYFDGHRYLGVSLRTHPPFDRVGSIPESHLQRIGTATRKPGHRTKHAVTGSASPPPVEVASIEGVSPEIAIAGVPRGNVYLREGATIPSALTSAPWVQWRMCS